jgi:hypothetical protein
MVAAPDFVGFPATVPSSGVRAETAGDVMRRWFLIVGAVALSTGAARGDVLYNGFADTTGLTINGHAFTTTTSDGVVLRLTNSQGDRGGSAFSTAQVSTSTFLSVYSFRIGNNGGAVFDNNTENGADGLAFLVQNQANNVGGIGGGMGYLGINPSLAVEYDTWGNSAANDPSQSHVGITLNGNVNHGSPGQGPTVNIGDTNGSPGPLPGPELDDGFRYWSWTIYDGTTLRVYLERSESTTEPSLPATPILTFNTNLQNVLGGPLAFAGFTAATGAAWSNHDIIYWRYIEAVPEPSTVLLIGVVGAAALASRLRRRVKSSGASP